MDEKQTPICRVIGQQRWLTRDAWTRDAAPVAWKTPSALLGTKLPRRWHAGQVLVATG